jgi:hypothetical protein
MSELDMGNLPEYKEGQTMKEELIAVRNAKAAMVEAGKQRDKLGVSGAEMERAKKVLGELQKEKEEEGKISAANEKRALAKANAARAAKGPGCNPMIDAAAGGGGGKADKVRLHPTQKMTHEAFVALQRGVDDDAVEEKAERMRAIEEASAVYQFTCKQLDDLLAAMGVQAERM